MTKVTITQSLSHNTDIELSVRAVSSGCSSVYCVQTPQWHSLSHSHDTSLLLVTFINSSTQHSRLMSCAMADTYCPAQSETPVGSESFLALMTRCRAEGAVAVD